MENSAVVHGTCDGTGAAINVCLGFIPRHVKVINAEDAGTLTPEVEWTKGMKVISAIDEGIMLEGADDADRQLLDTGGISEYPGGDEIVFDSASGGWVDNLTDLTAKDEVYVNGHYERAVSTDPAYQCYGDSVDANPRHGMKVKTPPGFTIGTNADLNVNGEQLLWIATR
ncbi:MAG TPA: hypothetical protein VMW06_03350 [Desulfobacterales bacterium]|nr:hypothetical protein [Desulfobacterales bacterium]